MTAVPSWIPPRTAPPISHLAHRLAKLESGATAPSRERAARARSEPPQSPGAALFGYAALGAVLAALIVTALVLVERGRGATGSDKPAAITDETVRIPAEELSASCVRAVEAQGRPIVVAFQVGLDGRVQAATAAGSSPDGNACIEAHVRGWAFLPQAESASMVVRVGLVRPR